MSSNHLMALMASQERSFREISRKIRDSFSKAWMVSPDVARRFFFLKKKSFLRRTQIMGKAHVPFSDAIAELKSRAYENHESIMFAALQVMNLRVQRAQDLAQVLNGWLAPEEIMLIVAGDNRGFSGYVSAIDQVLGMGDATAEMRSALLMGVMEPIILLVSIYMLMLWMSTKFTGKLLSITHVSPDKLTGLAYQFYAMGQFANSIWSILVPVVIFVPPVLVWWSFSRWTGERTKTVAVRKFLDKIPPYSVYKKIAGAQWALAFSVLAMAGIPYEVVLQELGRLSAPWVRVQTHRIERRFRKGITLGDAMRQAGDWFPSRSMVQDIMAFGERPGFKETMKVLADESIKDTTREVKIMANVLRGFGYVIMFVALVWLYEAFNDLSTQIQTLLTAGH